MSFYNIIKDSNNGKTELNFCIQIVVFMQIVETYFLVGGYFIGKIRLVIHFTIKISTFNT